MSRLRFAVLAIIVIGTVLAQDDAQPAAKAGAPQPSPSRAQQSEPSATPVPGATPTSTQPTYPLPAEGSTAQIGAIHVDPSTSGERVRFSPAPPNEVKNSGEVATSLRQALAVNGVDAPNATPWHALLTYDVFDEDGDNSHSGSVEVFSVNDKKYRRVFQSDTRTLESRPLTEIATGSQLYHVGDQGWPTMLELQVIREALGPWDDRMRSTDVMPDRIEWEVGKTKLSCIIIRKRNATVSDNGLPKFCFDPGTQVLRYTRGSGWDETVYNNITQFQGRFVAADVEVTHSGKPYITIHLAKIEPLTHVDDALFSPPAGIPGPISGRVTIPGGVFVNQYLISRVMPTYPRGAHGKVNVRFVVGKDGHVIEADASDGPDELRKPVEHAIRKWIFRPYSILGQPIEVQTNITFQLQ